MADFAFLNDADLHGLVDGFLPAERRSDVLRRLATTPADRAKVEAWQDQNDLIRGAFAGIDREPLPRSLDITPPPRLRCIPAAEPPLVEPRVVTAPPQRSGALAGFATMLVIIAGLSGSWMVIQAAGDVPSAVADVELRGPTEDTLTATGLGAVAAGGTTVEPATAAMRSLPTAKIPDLSRDGFVFTSAETRVEGAKSLVFHYRNAAADQLTIMVAKATDAAPRSGPNRVGQGYAWHRDGTAFAIAGTVKPERLRAIAVALDTGAER